MSSNVATRIDLREITPRDRHALVFEGFDGLKAGEALELVNDHDPVPLRSQFDMRSPGGFAWKALEAGPDLWRVQITRSPALAAVPNDSCCSGGACGG